MVDHDDIVDRRVLRVAREHKMTAADVREALDKHPMNTERDTFLRRTLAMELVELDELQAAFRDKALKDRDVAAGALLVKVAERRQVLLGLAAPAGHAVTVVYHEPVERQTSLATPLGAVLCQVISLVLTAMYWGRWQAQLARDPRGPESPYLAKILNTHWIRTLLVNAYALILLLWAIAALT